MACSVGCQTSGCSRHPIGYKKGTLAHNNPPKTTTHDNVQSVVTSWIYHGFLLWPVAASGPPLTENPCVDGSIPPLATMPTSPESLIPGLLCLGTPPTRNGPFPDSGLSHAPPGGIRLCVRRPEASCYASGDGQFFPQAEDERVFGGRRGIVLPPGGSTWGLRCRRLPRSDVEFSPRYQRRRRGRSVPGGGRRPSDRGSF